MLAMILVPEVRSFMALSILHRNGLYSRYYIECIAKMDFCGFEVPVVSGPITCDKYRSLLVFFDALSCLIGGAFIFTG